MSTPQTHDQLHSWIQQTLGITLSRSPRLSGHSSHFNYIAHSYFTDTLLTAPSPPIITEPLDAVVLAPRGGGKTFLAALATTIDLVHKAGIQIRILAGSEDQGTRMLAYLRKFFSRPALAQLLDGKGTRTSVTLANGSAVHVLSQSHASVRGIRVHKIKCDEVELFHPDIFAAVQLTTLSEICGDFHIRGTIDCLSTQHLVGGIMQRLVKESDDGARRLFRWSLLDVLASCPGEYSCRPLPDAAHSAKDCALLTECAGRAKITNPTIHGHMPIADALRMKSRVDEDTWHSEMLCLRPGRSQAVFGKFERSTHIATCDPSPPGDPGSRGIICGMDFGFRSPTVILWGVRELQSDGTERLTIVDEYVQTQRSIQEHIAVLSSRASGEHHHLLPFAYPHALKPDWIGADPAGAANTGASSLGSHISQLRRAGFVVRMRRSDVESGLNLLRAKLFPAAGAARLVIHSRCERLIEALENYHYPSAIPSTELPEKDGPDHLCDALRYMIVNLEHGTVTTRRFT